MSFSKEEIHSIVLKQREYFLTNETLSIKFRKEQLKTLRRAILENQDQLIKALHEDLGRCEVEAYFCDIGDVVMEINEYLKGLSKWSKPEKHFSGLACFPSLITRVYKLPYGVSLIIAPFNFPVLLSLGVLLSTKARFNASYSSSAAIRSSSSST